MLLLLNPSSIIMVSIRRTLSPSGNSRTYQRPPPSSSPTSALIRRILMKQPSAWWRSLLLCFLLGFLLGLFPLADLDLDLDADDTPHSHHFSFDPPPSSVSVSVIRPAQDQDQDHLQISTRKLLIVITPTYNRALQAYYLNRLGQTLRLVPPPLLWVVVETKEATEETARILRRTGVMYRHLVCKKRSTNPKDRGVHQRNTALKHIKHHHMDGIIYFADDDNIYSLQLFRELRDIRRFGTWPVAMLARSKSKATIEGPVCNGSQVIGWHTNEKSKRLRRFHVDMSGFAFNSTILWDPKRWNCPTKDLIVQLDTVKEGFQETTFIAQVVEDESQMEGIPNGCSRIMNWHLHLEAGDISYPSGWEFPKNLDVVLPLK